MTGFYEQFDRHDAWRREVSQRLRVLADWLKDANLLDAGSEERVRRLIEQVRADKIMVAFVAEFSRGKSELINAVFFSEYGRRIMPASPGRTTMCPTELAYEPSLPACLRLLPIDTRLQPKSLLEWRLLPEKWMRLDLEMDNPDQLVSAMKKVSETMAVSKEEAAALGFWYDDRPEDNPPVNADGSVVVPRWRHALVNMAHPLLKQGLIVLDTPGLNAIGAEPELTVNLIPQAQAAVFVLAADTGVTKSDLTMWSEHLALVDEGQGVRLAVLNKIDTLWDDLSTAEEIDAQIEQQRIQAAQVLSLEPQRVLALSAQKGLKAKVRADASLLARSGLPAFEHVLGNDLLGARRRLLEGAILTGVQELQGQAQRLLGVRRRELFEQMRELRNLHGKNQSVLRQMRARVNQEVSEFDRGASSVLAVRSEHTKLLREVFRLLGSSSIKKELAPLTDVLRQPGIKFGVKKAYAEGFGNLRGVIEGVRAIEVEIEALLTKKFDQLNTEQGFELKLPAAPDLSGFETDLSVVERSHLQYLGLGAMFRLSRPEFSERLARALLARVRSIFDATLSEIELWNRSSSAQLAAQLRERRDAFDRRTDAIERMEGAAGGLGERLTEIESQEIALNALDSHLDRLARELRQTRPVRAQSSAFTVLPA